MCIFFLILNKLQIVIENFHLKTIKYIKKYHPDVGIVWLTPGRVRLYAFTTTKMTQRASLDRSTHRRRDYYIYYYYYLFTMCFVNKIRSSVRVQPTHRRKSKRKKKSRCVGERRKRIPRSDPAECAAHSKSRAPNFHLSPVVAD